MGMIACYQEAGCELIENLRTKKIEDIFEEIEELQASKTVEIYTLDKMWDGLHFILTGVSASNPIEDNLLSEAIVGTYVFGDDEDDCFISCIYPERLKEITDALKEFDIEKALSSFSPKMLAKNKIYPQIWVEKDTALLRQELLQEFFALRKFYHEMIAKNTGIIVSIY